MTALTAVRPREVSTPARVIQLFGLQPTPAKKKPLQARWVKQDGKLTCIWQ